MENSCDVEGPKYPCSAIDGKMQSSRVGLSLRRHRVIKLDDYPKIEISTQCHERLHMVSLHEEHGVSKLRVLGKCQEIVVNLLVHVSPTTVNIPLDGSAMKGRSLDNGCRG